MLEFQIDDMNCNRCVAVITGAVRSLDHSAKIRIDLAAKRVYVDSPVGPYKLAAAICCAGFQPASVRLGADARST